MGKPAARLGDSTCHGGVITGPGCPTVLIGGMPAARMGDMHVCPMATPGTPPIPHVGGSILLGSTGVFIGGAPAARMGDMAMCVGPPSSVIMGCMTVLIGEAGAGGGSGGAGAGGGGGGGTATAGALTSAAMSNQTPQTNQQGDHFLDMSFSDDANLPVGGMRYTLEYPNKAKQTGVLGGRIGMTSVPEGSYTVSLRAIVNAAWSAREARTGTPVTLEVDTEGAADGEKATLDIYVRDGNHGERLLETFATAVRNNQLRQQWTMKADDATYRAMCEAKTKKGSYSLPFFFFKAGIGELSGQSGPLYLHGDVEIHLNDKDGKTAANRKFTARLASGETRHGTADGSG
ncbi:MAG TPA: PAAR domain-containing protein, partial [Chitinivibrionales bacterium]|nr:PAAR domain-containing protein [Chitinivibrionales bacterium]